MAYVVTFSLSCSFLAAVTLIPMLSARFLKYRPVSNGPAGRLAVVYSLRETFLRRSEEIYGRLLEKALRHRRQVVLTVLGLFLVSFVLVRFIGVELMPAADESEVRVNLEMAVGTRMEIVDQVTRTVEEIVRRQVPEMVSMLTRVGSGGEHTASLQITLVPKSERQRSSEDVANALRRPLGGLPGVTVRTRAGQGLFLLRMGAGQSDNVSVEIRGYDLKTGHQLAQQVERAIQQAPGITDTKISSQEGESGAGGAH
jgi:HAE1 family hydrophobic/amphiphilic exporter-1